MTGGPDPIVALPAAGLPQLRGRRVIVGVPGIGFRDGLRADDAVVQGGRTIVPVLTEQDYYQAEIEQVEMFALLVPIERVWVEHIGGAASQAQSALDHPPMRQALPVSLVRSILGRRLVQAVPDGHVRDLRAATEVHGSAKGDRVRVCSELDWYRWALQGAVPSTVDTPADLLWCE
jgi:hypothetical protein